MSQEKTYAEVIIPLKISGSMTYSIPEKFFGKIEVGTRVTVPLQMNTYAGVVSRITDAPGYDVKKIKDILDLDPQPAIAPAQIRFWEQMARYYLCTPGEVFKAACPATLRLSAHPRSTEEDKAPDEARPLVLPPPLTGEQEQAMGEIKHHFQENAITVLTGENGSGKTEIAVHLIQEYLDKGENVLMLAPYINDSKRLAKRFEKVFGPQLLIYNSNLSLAKRRKVISVLAGQREDPASHPPMVVLGLSTALFLPFDGPGLIIVYNEHSPLFKRIEPAPRYNGRDAATMLGQLTGAHILMTSPTPSFETLGNIHNGKYREVHLTRRYDPAIGCTAEWLDMKKERLGAGNRFFSGVAIHAIDTAIAAGDKALIYTEKFPKYPLEEIKEEMLRRITLPEGKEEKSLKSIIFREGAAIEDDEIRRLSTVIVLRADQLNGYKSFRSDERGIQLFNSIAGLINRPNGRMIVQTYHPEHPVFSVLAGKAHVYDLVAERKAFHYPPFAKVLDILIRDRYEQRLDRTAEEVVVLLGKLGVENILGPTDHTPLEFKGIYARIIQITLPKKKSTEEIKRKLKEEIDLMDRDIVLDVDPQ